MRNEPGIGVQSDLSTPCTFINHPTPECRTFRPCLGMKQGATGRYERPQGPAGWGCSRPEAARLPL